MCLFRDEDFWACFPLAALFFFEKAFCSYLCFFGWKVYVVTNTICFVSFFVWWLFFLLSLYFFYFLKGKFFIRTRFIFLIFLWVKQTQIKSFDIFCIHVQKIEKSFSVFNSFKRSVKIPLCWMFSTGYQ